MMYNRLFILISLTLLSFGREVTAANLLELNPTPIELNSASISDEAYQLAKVTWLPDYLGENKSHSRVMDGGKTRGSNDDVHNQRCAAYNKLGSCPSHSVGEGRKVYPGGLVCYDECVCDMSYYKYTVGDCSAKAQTVSGEKCQKKKNGALISYYSACKCSDSYDISEDVYNTYVTKNTATCQSCTDDTGTHYKCRCSTQFKYDTAVTNASCDYCTVTPARVPESTYKYKCTCNDLYVMNAAGTACEKDCTGYNNTSCPEGANCEQCTAGGVKKYKITSCKETEGWEVGSTYRLTGEIATCNPKKCSTGYDAGVTSCSGDGYTLKTDGKSGGKTCGMCVCSYGNNACASSDYPLFAQSVPNASGYDYCISGCGAERVIQYRVISCKAPYKVNDAGTACVSDTCPDGYLTKDELSSIDGRDTKTTEAGTICYKAECHDYANWYSTTVKEHAQCLYHTYGDLKCYHGCKCDAGYFPNSNHNCEQCQKGTYNPEPIPTGSTRTGCELCSPGTYQSGYAGTKCDACLRGMYQNQPGQEKCEICPEDTYSDTEGATECTHCPTGTTTNGQKGKKSKSACVEPAGCTGATVDKDATWCKKDNKTPTMDCNTLGYTQTSCSSKESKLVCPFDSSKYACF